jgi:hypothetical protein
MHSRLLGSPLNNVCCVFYSNEAEGFWSQEGVTTEVAFYDEEKKTYDVICKSNHLTSFAVMLDVNMALSVSSYLQPPLLVSI